MASIKLNIDLTTLSNEELLHRKTCIIDRLKQLEETNPKPIASKISPQTIPTIPKSIDTHTDFLHKELAWLSADYASERKRQISTAKKLSASILHHFATLPAKRARERAEFEARTRRLAARLSRGVQKNYWQKIERVVGYKQKIEAEGNKRREMDRSLIWMVKQTERYGESLRGEDGVATEGVSIEAALRNEDNLYSSRRKKKDYAKMDRDGVFESLYGQDGDDEDEYVLAEDEEEMETEKADYAIFMKEMEKTSQEEIGNEVVCLIEEGELELEEVLRRMMAESEINHGDCGSSDGKKMIEVIDEAMHEDNEGNNAEEDSSKKRRVSFAPNHEEGTSRSTNDNKDGMRDVEMLQEAQKIDTEPPVSNNADTPTSNQLSAQHVDTELPVSDNVDTITSNRLSLLDEDDFEEKDEFHPIDEVDDETTIEAEEILGRDMSYADEIALLQRENEMSIEDLRAMYANMDENDSTKSDQEESADDATVTANNLTLLDEDDFEEKDEFHPTFEVDDETTIEAEEKLGRDMSYADEIALLQRQNEMPIEELRAMYANMEADQVNSEDDDDTMEADSSEGADVTQEAEPSAYKKSSLSLLTAAIDEDETDDQEFIQDNDMELDDETTIEAEEKLGREMTYEQEISELEKENEMSVQELRKLYGLDPAEDETASVDDETKRKRDSIGDDSDNEHTDKRPRFAAEEEDEGLMALRSLAASDAKARETMLTRPFLLASWVKLRNYQHIGLNWLVSLQSRRLNGILADEMGLGKTLQTIAMLAYLASYKGIWGPHLVIVPTSCLVNWEVEFKRFCPGLKVVCYYGNAKRRKELRYGWTKTNFHHVVITSYQLAVQDSFAFKRKKWYYLILDEAHNIKNFESQRWQTLINFNTQRRLLLTGTPLQNNLMELWSLLHFLMPHVFRNRKDFAYWFSNPMDNIIEGNVKRNDDLINRLHGIIRPFVLRRLKKDVETQLPGKFEHIVKCQLSRRQMFLYEEFMARSSTRKAMHGGNFMGMMNVLMQLRKVCNHPDLFEPRSVVTPFSMEPLSMSTATCVVDAIEPKSGLERLSSSLLFPLWSLGHGLPSLEGASLVDSIFANQLAELVTPTSIIVERARSRGSLEPEPHTEMDSGLASFLSRLRDLDLQNQLDQAQFVGGMNSMRCSTASFPYSDRLKRAITLDNLPLDMPLIDELAASQIAMTPTDLLAMRKSQEQRAEEAKDLIDKFVFCVPKAGATSKPVLFAGSAATSSSIIEKELLSKTSEEFVTYFSPFQKARSRLTLCFPDKKLVQFDAGKLQTLARLLSDLKQGGHRVLIFTQMSKMLDVLEAFLNLNGHTYLRLDGATDVDKRQRLMDRFNNDPKIFCFILSTRSGGLGINLTGADTVVFYDSDWNPAMDAQAQDRAHRIGQTREVHIYRMVTEHSIEENILTKAKQKRNLDFLVMDEGKFHATPAAEYSEDAEDGDGEEGFTKGRLKNILGIHTENADDAVAEDEEDLNQDQLQSAMNMLEDEDDVKAMHKAQKEAAEALEEFDESIQFKPDDEEGQGLDANDKKLAKPKKGKPAKKAVELNSSAMDLDQSDKADDSSREDEEDKAMELEFANWQSRVGMDASQINDSLNPLERYGLKIKEIVDPYYSKYFWAEQERLRETAALNNEWDLEEIERIKVEEEQRAFDDGDLLSTMPEPASLPRQRHLYQREKARLWSEIIKRKLTGQNWKTKKEETSGKSFWYNVDTCEAVWEKPLVLKMLDQEDAARAKGWSALPSKALVQVMEFLMPYPDRMNCSIVCRSWKVAANDISFVLHVWPVEMGALVMDEKKLLRNHFRTIADAVKVAVPGDTIELGDGHYWINDPGLEINVPIRFLGDEDDPSHVILELSGEIVWKANGGWMEGMTIHRPKLVTGATSANEVLRIEKGRIDMWHCVFDNGGSIGNCVSVAGSGAGGNWERVSIHGGSEEGSGIFLGQSTCLELIDCNISSNAGAGITRIDGSELKLSNCTIDKNGSDRIKRLKEALLPPSPSVPPETHVLVADSPI